MLGGSAYPENLARVILVVINGTVAQPAVAHDGIQPRVRHRDAATAARRLRTADEGVDGGVATVLLLDFGVTPATHEEPSSSCTTSHSENTDDTASDDTGDVDTAATVLLVTIILL